MRAGTSPHTSDRQADPHPAETIWQAIREILVEVKKPIDREIRSYPPPIPACDAHFNYLLEQRAAIAREMNRLDAARQQRSAPADCLAAIDAFLRSSPYIDNAAAEKLRAACKDAFAALAGDAGD